MEPFRVIIAGGRDFDDYPYLKQKCDALLRDKKRERPIVILSGKCSGADRLGERYAKEQGFEIDPYPADWTRYGASAGPRRNRQMAAKADALIAFHDGRSRGTKNMIEEAEARRLSVRVCLY